MKRNLEEKLKNLNVVVASHIFATGPALELEEYLKRKVKRLTFIGHPFSYTKDLRSFCRIRENGILSSKSKSVGKKLPGVIIYIKEAIYTFYWVLVSKNKINLFIGSDNYMAFLGLLLKKMGKVQDVILYTIDYSPQRFNNPILNYVYHFFDEQCLKDCKIVWNVSERIKTGRKDRGIDPKKSAPQIVVPLGVWIDRIPNLSISKKRKCSIVFLGHLLKKQGLQKVIEAMPEISRKHENVNLLIIGTGPYKSKLKKLIRKYKLEKKVIFVGYVESHKKVERYLSKSMLAVAPYEPIKSSFTYFADPGKIKNYLAAGLPVLLTNVPRIAKEVNNTRCGYIVKYDSEDIADKINKLFFSEQTLINFSKNARRFATGFDWNKIFSVALNKSIS